MLSFFFCQGNLGNSMFFFLSSYGLCFSYTNNSLAAFYQRRIIRIYPLVLIYFIIAVYADSESINRVMVELPKQISGYSLVTNYCKAWFVQALTLVYILFPILFMMVEWVYKRGIGYLISLFIILLVVKNFIYPFYAYLAASHIVVILLGILTYLCERDGKLDNLLAVYGITFLFAFTRLSNIGLIVPGIAYFLSFVKSRNRFLIFIGKHSLEIYLSQILIIPMISIGEGNIHFYYIRVLISIIFVSFLFGLLQYFSTKIIRHYVPILKA